MIGVALVGFITILAASTKDSIDGGRRHSFRADYVVESGFRGTQGFATTDRGRPAGRPGVDLLSPVRSARPRSTARPAT